MRNPKIRVFVPADFYGIDEGHYEMSKTTYAKLKKVVSKINESNYDEVRKKGIYVQRKLVETQETHHEYILDWLATILKDEAIFIEENHKYTLCITESEQVQLFEGRKAVAGYSR